MHPGATIITAEDAKCYVRDHLKIPNFEERVHKNRMEALNVLIRTTLATYPFQNIDLMATSASVRRVPTHEDMKKSFLSAKKGGLCMTMNNFHEVILHHFGYKTYLGSAHVTGSNYPDNHSIIIVQDLVETGDLHLVDVGCGYPTFEAIPLKGEPRVFKHSFLEFIVRKMGDDSWYGRYNLKGDPREELGREALPDKLFYKFTLEPRSEEFFREAMLGTFTDPENSMFLRSIYCCFYPEGKGITLKDNFYRIYDERTGEATKAMLSTFDDYLTVFRDEIRMPGLDEKELKSVVELFQTINEHNSH